MFALLLSNHLLLMQHHKHCNVLSVLLDEFLQHEQEVHQVHIIQSGRNQENQLRPQGLPPGLLQLWSVSTAGQSDASEDMLMAPTQGRTQEVQHVVKALVMMLVMTTDEAVTVQQVPKFTAAVGQSQHLGNTHSHL